MAWGLVGVAVTLAITFVGSDGLLWFDAALIGYVVLGQAGTFDPKPTRVAVTSNS